MCGSPESGNFGRASRCYAGQIYSGTRILQTICRLLAWEAYENGNKSKEKYAENKLVCEEQQLGHVLNCDKILSF